MYSNLRGKKCIRILGERNVFESWGKEMYSNLRGKKCIQILGERNVFES